VGVGAVGESWYNKLRGESKYGRDAMEAVTIEQIEEQLRRLPPEKLAVVFDFVSYLTDRDAQSELTDVLLAAESSLRKDWERPEEDEAWAHL
jgi:hypothetical protein